MAKAVLISGGVDSAVAVHLLKEAGEDLHLFYIRIGMDDGRGDCSAEEDIEICRLIARRYGLPLDVVPLHEEYWEHVMAYALRTVKEGRTPHPDMMCNRMIKFGFFEERWGKEFEKTVTGHYATVRKIDDRYYLGTAVDPVKDQTDFLAQITYSQLSHAMFPLGDLPKAEVRRLAKEAALPNAGRKDSQGICFLGKIDYNEFLRRHLGEKTGAVVEIETGKKIGEHKGYWFHTIGQRKGLGLGGGPWFVVRKNVRENVLYVSHGYETPLQYGRQLNLSEMHWISGEPDEVASGCMKVAFKNRHTPTFINGLLRSGENGEMVLESDTNVQGIAPGQFAVIYSPDRKLCLGSAVITAHDPEGIKL